MPVLSHTTTVTLRNESCQHLSLSSSDTNTTVSPPRASSSLDLSATRGSTLVLYLSTYGDEEKGDTDGVELAISGKGTRLLRETGSWWVFQRVRSRREVELVVYDKVVGASWMGEMRDDVLLSSLNLPGTHESLAFYGYPISTCQTLGLTLSDQLQAGHRFLDLRFALKDGVIRAFHGIQNEYSTAEVELGRLYAFLASEEGKRETVIVSIKQENFAKGFEKAMWALLDQNKQFWYDEDRFPTLGEVRGKGVLFCRFGFESKRGLHPTRWPNNAGKAWSARVGGQDIVVQDWYSIGSFLQIPEKAALALSLLKRTLLPPPSPLNLIPIPIPPRSPTAPLPLRLSFLSAATFLTAFPFVCAKGLGWPWMGIRGMNERALEGLLDSDYRGEEGDGGFILLMDYWETPGGLTELMICWNERFSV